MINMKVKLTDDFTKQLKKLGDGIKTHVARSTARAGALAYYQTLLDNTPIGPTGNLHRSAYHAYADDASTANYKEYQVGFRGNYGKKQTKQNEGAARSNHLHLVEFGHIVRYAYKKDKNTGEWITLVRPQKMGTPRPNPQTASQAEMDAYYIPLKRPFQIPGKGFVRRSFDQAKALAPMAMEKRASERLAELIKNPSLASKYVD
jgi:hypothetical protein